MADSTRETIFVNLAEAFEDAMDDTGYPTQIKRTSQYDENVLVVDKAECPLLMIIDEGDDDLKVQDSTHQRFRTTVKLRGFVKADTMDDLQPTLNKLISTLRNIVSDGFTTLGVNVLEFKCFGGEANRYDTRPESVMAETVINGRLTWYAVNGTF